MSFRTDKKKSNIFTSEANMMFRLKEEKYTIKDAQSEYWIIQTRL